MILSERWLRYGFRLCQINAEMSKDPSTKVGAVILRPDKTLLSAGWNGFPPGDPDRKEDYENRELKYSKIIHAEMNAILGASERPKDCYLFTWPLPPCDRCAPHIIKSGISTVYFPYYKLNERWAQSCKVAGEIFAGTKVRAFPILVDQLFQGVPDELRVPSYRGN